MRRQLEEQDAEAVIDVAVRTIPSGLRPSAFAIVADLLLADGKIDAKERRFLQRLAEKFRIGNRRAAQAVDVMLTKNHL